MISRRQLLHFSALISFCYPFANIRHFAMAEERMGVGVYPQTRALLQEAYWAEIIANKHYAEFRQKALSESYPNIAYLFHALSISEKIHADGFEKILVSLGSTLQLKQIPISYSDTKTNLNTASIKELEKINKFYPELIRKLSPESHDQTVLNCMYSWRSHRQHEEILRDIKRFSGLFFRSLANKIEKMEPNYYVCEICGSTVDEKPGIPCEICNYPLYHYKKIKRPT